MRTKINVSGTIELTYDPNSEEFKEALLQYRLTISPQGSIENMLCHVAYNITQFGTGGMIEGVGYVSVDGRKPNDEWCGIDVDSDYDDFEFDVD